MSNQFSFLLVGAGGMGHSHTSSLQSSGCKLVSVVDKDAEKAHCFAEKYHAIRWSSDYLAEMVES